MAAFSEDLFSKDEFEAVLVTLGCYHYSANSSDTVEKILTGRQDYHTFSLGAIANLSSINNIKKCWLLGHLRGD